LEALRQPDASLGYIDEKSLNPDKVCTIAFSEAAIFLKRIKKLPSLLNSTAKKE